MLVAKRLEPIIGAWHESRFGWREIEKGHALGDPATHQLESVPLACDLRV
jgi:hypothetical protein